jgi:hypothetical protein
MITSSSPAINGTSPRATRLHDDKNTYTGVYAKGGPTNNGHARSDGEGHQTLDMLVRRVHVCEAPLQVCMCVKRSSRVSASVCEVSSRKHFSRYPPPLSAYYCSVDRFHQTHRDRIDRAVGEIVSDADLAARKPAARAAAKVAERKERHADQFSLESNTQAHNAKVGKEADGLYKVSTTVLALALYRSFASFFRVHFHFRCLCSSRSLSLSPALFCSIALACSN